jgi:hypothetical protein
MPPFPLNDFAIRILSPAALTAQLKMTARRFPPPWSIDELETCFVVRDHSGQALIKGTAVVQEYLP